MPGEKKSGKANCQLMLYASSCGPNSTNLIVSSEVVKQSKQPKNYAKGKTIDQILPFKKRHGYAHSISSAWFGSP